MNRTISFLLDAIADEYQVERGDIESSTKRQDVAHARQCAYYCAKQLLPELSQVALAKTLSRDPQTVGYGDKEHLKRIVANQEIADRTMRIITTVRLQLRRVQHEKLMSLALAVEAAE